MIKEPPSKEQLLEWSKQLPQGMKSFINPMKVEDPYYVAHIKGREDQLSEEELADLFHRFPDLLKKPLTTNGSAIVLGPDKEKLESLIGK